MNQANRALALITTFGAVGGVGAYASGLLNNKPKKVKEKQEEVNHTINNRLTEEGFKVLSISNEDNDDWDAILVEYKKATTRSFSGEKEGEKTREQLQQDCSKALESKSTTDSDYKLAQQWCVKKESINIILGRMKKRLLSFDASDNQEEKKHWTNKVEELKKDKDRFSAIKDRINDLETANEENITVLKDGCKSLKVESTETTSDEFANNFLLAKDWCSIEQQ